MSRKTRTKRPTTATPRKVGTRRYLHISTDYAWRPVNPLNPLGPAHFVKVGRGETYRKVQP
jgi:hypothetical protein